MKTIHLLAVVGMFALSAGAGIEASRFGALYYPGETAVFTTDRTGSWMVADARDAQLASGTVVGGSATVSHEALGGKFGVFKLTVSGETTWFAFLRSTMERPCSWVGTGTHSSFGWQKNPVDFRYLDLVRAAGIGIVRDDVLWESYDKNKGVYTFDDKHNLTLLVNNLRLRGLRFHPVLTGKNVYYDDNLDKDAFVAFATAFVNTFKGAFPSCDIYNEPHNAHFPEVYGMDTEEGGEKVWITKHRELTRAAVSAMKTADPTFSPAVGVEDYWDLFGKYMLRVNNTEVASGLVVADDLVSLHTYGTSEELAPEKNYFFVDGGVAVRNALTTYGGGANRIAITEAGWSTYDGEDASAKLPPATLDEQARYLVRFYLLARQHGIEFACQYDFMDHADKAGKASRNFGLVREDGTPKPAFGAVATMTRILGEATSAGSASADTTAYRFYDFTRGGRTISAAWSLAGTKTVDVPASHSFDGVHCLDLQGNEIALPVNGNKLTLTEDPVYFVEGDLDDLFSSMTSQAFSPVITVMPAVRTSQSSQTGAVIDTERQGVQVILR